MTRLHNIPVANSGNNIYIYARTTIGYQVIFQISLQWQCYLADTVQLLPLRKQPWVDLECSIHTRVWGTLEDSNTTSSGNHMAYHPSPPQDLAAGVATAGKTSGGNSEQSERAKTNV